MFTVQHFFSKDYRSRIFPNSVAKNLFGLYEMQTQAVTLFILLSWSCADGAGSFGNLGTTDVSSGNKLDALLLKWAPPQAHDPDAFAKMPKTTVEAKNEGWTLLDDGCKNKSAGYSGQRYYLKEIPEVLLIYDGQGHVAGLQLTIKKDEADNSHVINFSKAKYANLETILGQDVYVLTVYFMDPEKVCKGRSDEDVKREGTASQVHIKQGKNDYMVLPKRSEDQDALEKLGWTREWCVPSMGGHYYYKVDQYYKCEDVLPYFLIFDWNSPKKEFLGIGYFLFGQFESRRYEIVPNNTLEWFIYPLPDCVYPSFVKSNGISGMHIFFTETPSSITCPKGSMTQPSIEQQL